MLADETSDVSQTEQFSLCMRYVEPSTMTIREDFLCFLAVEDVSASNLAHTLKHELLKLGLNLKLMRGQGYDGAAVMSGAFRGVQALIRDEFPTALYTHCSSHSLNFCLSDASAVLNGPLARSATFAHSSGLPRKGLLFSRGTLKSRHGHSVNYGDTVRRGGGSVTKPFPC